MHFKNKVVWITGASSGIGAALAKKLAIQQAWLILTARNKQALNEVAAQCGQHTPHCKILPADLLDATLVESLGQQAIAIYGRLDIAIFNAGTSQRSFAGETNMTVYRQLMELNFFAPVMLTQSLLTHFQQRSRGHIVVISSMAGLMGFPLRTGYAASKHALKGFFETLQTEHQIKGLNITIVSPGRINTPISANAILGDGRLHGKMDKGQLEGIPVDACVRKILSAITHKKQHVIIARSEKVLWWIWWFARPLYYRIARRKGLEAAS